MKNTNNKQKTQKAYTLIEVLIAIAIFFTVVAGPTGLFIFSLKNQNRILGTREVIDNSSHVFEYMSRALRMARKELNCTDRMEPETCSCLKDGGYGSNYEKTNSRTLDGTVYNGPGIKFNNAQQPSICQEFFWDELDNRLKESKNGAAPVPLTSDDLEVVSFKFEEFGLSQNDNIQPRVAVFLELTKKSQVASPTIKIQTVISQRNLDVMY